MNTKRRQQFDAEIGLCDAVANLLRVHGYSVSDVRQAIGSDGVCP